jgi:hypothetical protein
VICDSKDGTSGIRGEKSRGARRNDRELKVHGFSRVPPLWLDESLIRTGRKIDILPGMEAGGASTGGVEEYVDVGGVETSGIPSDVERSSVLKRLGSGRGDVKAAAIAGRIGTPLEIVRQVAMRPSSTVGHCCLDFLMNEKRE